MSTSDLVKAIPGWDEAMARLKDLLDEREAEARAAAAGYADVYAGRRAAMVFDVVASRQRKYETRVQSLIRTFESTDASRSLHALANDPPVVSGLQRDEPATMSAVAAGLIRYSEAHGLDIEAGVKAWATAAEPFRHASKLEPYVGMTHGMGTALFAYLRMRCGADALKPDLRVRGALVGLGLHVPNDPHAILMLAEAAADHAQVPRLVLDQAFWGPR